MVSSGEASQEEVVSDSAVIVAVVVPVLALVLLVTAVAMVTISFVIYVRTRWVGVRRVGVRGRKRERFTFFFAIYRSKSAGMEEVPIIRISNGMNKIAQDSQKVDDDSIDSIPTSEEQL